MIKKEIKTYLKSFLIWAVIITVLYIGVALIYPFVITDETMKSMDELIQVFPPEMLKAFNMDLASVSTYYGWLKTEGFTFLLMIIGIYASIMGGTILLVEESEKTKRIQSLLPRSFYTSVWVGFTFSVGIVSGISSMSPMSR